MNTTKTLLSALLLFVCAIAQAQTSDDYDRRVKKMLDKLDIKYEISPKGNFKVVYKMGGGRTQLVYIYSNTNKYGDLEIREVISTAGRGNSADAFTHSTLLSLLTKNHGYKMGAWQIEEADGKYSVQFACRIDANISAKEFEDILELCSKLGDEMEQKLTDGDEF